MRSLDWLPLGSALLVAAGLAAPALQAADSDPGHEFFERKIRPLLVERCFGCHAGGQKKGGLSLASRSAVLAGGDSGPVVQLDAPGKSALVAAIEYQGDIQMPPAGRLPDHEIALLKQWVAIGLPWPNADAGGAATIRTSGQITDQDRQFWSFQPYRIQPLPAVHRIDWPLNRSDVFLLARLEAESLAPSAAADRRTWLRRAALDLTGLPPGVDDLAEFLADAGPDAFERALDRLLASPRHGERWGRHWLDVARYGEDQAHTFQARMYPQGYRYRDWVVRSLNDDLPYDQFVTQQVAGDAAPDRPLDESLRIERSPALGFLALGPVYYADAGCAPKAQADEWDDRVDTLGRGLLGLTLACARCHDHKFDPITVQDYYGLAGVFASSKYEELPLAPATVVDRYNAAVARSKAKDDELAATQSAQARKLAEAMAPQLGRYLVAAWALHNRRKVKSDFPVSKMAEEFGVHDVVLEGWRKYIGIENRRQRELLADFDRLVAQEDAKLDRSTDAAARQAVEEIAARLQTTVTDALAERAKLESQYAEQLAAASEEQKSRIPKPQLPKPATDLLQSLLYDGKAPLNVPKDRLLQFVTGGEAEQLRQQLKAAEEAKQAIGTKYPIAHGLADAAPTNLKIHVRGNHKTLGAEGERRFLAVLSPAEPAPFRQGSGRLELAQAIASRDNPLTARVIVNRLWQQHFGHGIVDTPSNFGTLGSPPSHPELLDDLASRLVESGWSLKQMHREMMLGAAYRQSSADSAEGRERDPENRLLWHFARRRLEVEAWRDALLWVTGQLDLTLGGPSLNLNDANHRRRTLYSAVSRHELNGMLRLFDFPDPNLTSERRVITTVPMQQLFTLNSEFMIRQARELATQCPTVGDPADPGAATRRVTHYYQRVLQREPTVREIEACRAFVDAASRDEAQPNQKLSPWEQLAQVLLAGNEFMFVD